MSQSLSESAQSTGDVQVGSLLAGKYRVDRILGRGGMGVVVAATHLELESPVAIKLLLPEMRANQEVVARFAREARAAAQITSEFVARTIDVGRLENGCPYIVMEYLDGSDLAQRIAQQGPLAYSEAVRLILQACEALKEAHALGIIHRDLKPSNLFLARRRDGSEVAKLLDFGISKVTAVSSTGSDPSMTRTSSMMGSPLYMSPEQLVAARNVDQRSDVWALGVTLYEALAGEPPFTGESLPELCARVMTQAPRPIDAIRPDLPPQLAAIVMRCLEKAPEARFATATDLGLALRPFAGQATSGVTDRATGDYFANAQAAPQGVPQRQPPPQDAAPRQGSQPNLGVAVRTANSWGQTNDVPVIPKHSNRRLIFVGLGVLVAIAGILLVIKLNQSDANVASPTASSESARAIASSPISAVTKEPAVEIASAAAPSIASAIATQPSPIAGPRPTTAKAIATSAGARLGPSDRQPAAARAAKPGHAATKGSNDLFSDRN